MTTIESTGNTGFWPSCAKVDTDKACIFYQKDSDGDLYAQVLTVSGTSITTNTPVSVFVTNQSLSSVACQIETNKVLVVHDHGWSSNNVTGNVITISGTTPSVGANQSISGSFGTSSHRLGLWQVSSTKALLFASDDADSSSPSTDSVRILSIS